MRLKYVAAMLRNARSYLGAPAIVMLVVACGASERTGDARSAQTAKTSKTASLFFSEVELAPGRTFPSPLVRGSVNGKPTIFVIDTGAQASAVDATIAASAGLDLGREVKSSDPSGNAVEGMRTTERPHLLIDGLGLLAERPAVVMDFPPVMKTAGIGAILSPQALTANGSEVVLDLSRRELRIAGPNLESDAPATRPALALGQIDVCRWTEGDVPAKALVMRASIDGKPVSLEVDTGASKTFIVADSDVGRMLATRPAAERSRAVTAAGQVDIVQVEGVTARSGAVALDGAFSIMPGKKDERCGYEGRLGIDRLKSCRLILREASVTGTCSKD